MTPTTTQRAETPAVKQELRCRLRRIEGQIRGLERMVDQDRSCTDVLDQVAAVTAALRGVGLALVDDELRRCVGSETLSVAPDEAVQRATTAVARLLRIRHQPERRA